MFFVNIREILRICSWTMSVLCLHLCFRGTCLFVKSIQGATRKK